MSPDKKNLAEAYTALKQLLQINLLDLAAVNSYFEDQMFSTAREKTKRGQILKLLLTAFSFFLPLL